MTRAASAALFAIANASTVRPPVGGRGGRWTDVIGVEVAAAKDLLFRPSGQAALLSGRCGAGCAKTYGPGSRASFRNAPRASPERRHSLRTDGVHRVEHVEGQDGERRFRLYRSKSSGKESAAARHPFNCAEGVLDSTSTRHHQTRIGVDSGLHTVQRRLVE